MGHAVPPTPPIPEPCPGGIPGLPPILHAYLKVPFVEEFRGLINQDPISKDHYIGLVANPTHAHEFHAQFCFGGTSDLRLFVPALGIDAGNCIIPDHGCYPNGQCINFWNNIFKVYLVY